MHCLLNCLKKIISARIWNVFFFMSQIRMIWIDVFLKNIDIFSLMQLQICINGIIILLPFNFVFIFGVIPLILLHFIFRVSFFVLIVYIITFLTGIIKLVWFIVDNLNILVIIKTQHFSKDFMFFVVLWLIVLISKTPFICYLFIWLFFCFKVNFYNFIE